MKNNLDLTPAEVDEILSPRAIRDRAAKVFTRSTEGGTAFAYHPERLKTTVAYVLDVIEKNYPSLQIPFHSRWGHFQAGCVDRVSDLNRRISAHDPLERARVKLDLVITSVLLDAGAGMKWAFLEKESGVTLSRSEGLGVASFHMFLSGVMSSDRRSLRADAQGLKAVTVADIERAFQVTAQNPLVGTEGRVLLLNNLANALSNRTIFRDGRPGNVIDYLIDRFGRRIAAVDLLRAILDGLGPIWPGRLTANGKNLGDVWRYSKLSASPNAGRTSDLVPFHKLSQWMTYSLIEPMREAGLTITGVQDLTGLAEYRNGGLLVDAGLVSLRNPQDAERVWAPSSDLVIEWRALTVHLLDKIGDEVRAALGKSAEEFPLAKVLEGGTWWAGRFLAQEKRADGGPPFKVESDGTVF